MANYKLTAFFVAILLLIGIFMFLNGQKEIREVLVGDKTFVVEVARTKSEQERGLSLHTPLLNDQGMLFIFKNENFYAIWMKDMLFPIDVLWIDSNFKVVGIEKSISPDTYPKIFTPKAKSLYILEISAGQTDFLNTKLGDTVKFIKK